MAFNTIPTTEFDPTEPVKSEHGKAFYGNPIAIAEHDDSGEPAARIWVDGEASDASAIASTADANSTLVVSGTASPDGHGRLVVPASVFPKTKAKWISTALKDGTAGTGTTTTETDEITKALLDKLTWLAPLRPYYREGTDFSPPAGGDASLVIEGQGVMIGLYTFDATRDEEDYWLVDITGVVDDGSNWVITFYEIKSKGITGQPTSINIPHTSTTTTIFEVDSGTSGAPSGVFARLSAQSDSATKALKFQTYAGVDAAADHAVAFIAADVGARA